MKHRVILLSIFFFLFSFLGMFGVRKISAATTDQNLQEFGREQGDEKANLNQFIGNSVSGHSFAFLGLIVGCPDCSAPALQAGAIPSAGKFIASLYETKPAGTALYIADLMENAGIVQPAYAQGLGFSSLRPILELWKTFRNIAYVMFVIIFLIIGFAIMFRQKIGGQAEVTVQQAIPKIIVALLAVTFSYAIAGLLIDLMYVLMFFLVVIFSQSGLVDPKLVQIPGQSGNLGADSILSQNILEVGWSILTNGFKERASGTIGNLVESALGGGDFVFANLAGKLSSVLVTLVFAISILIAIFKTLFALIKVYFEIVMSIIFAPVMLMMGAINSGVFFNWVKGLAVNLMVFPALLLFILVAYMFMGLGGDGSIADQFNQGGFMPPFIPGRGDPQNIALIAGIGAMFLMAEVPNIVGKFKPKSMFDEFAGLAWKNATAGRSKGLDLARAGAMMPVGAGLGYWQGKKSGFGGLQGALAGAALGAVGPRRAARWGSSTLGKYGEFAENVPGVADDIEKGIVHMIPRALPAVRYIRERRRGGDKLPPIIPPIKQQASETYSAPGGPQTSDNLPFEPISSDGGKGKNFKIKDDLK